MVFIPTGCGTPLDSARLHTNGQSLSHSMLRMAEIAGGRGSRDRSSLNPKNRDSYSACWRYGSPELSDLFPVFADFPVLAFSSS
jgi:hypothetical protein